MNRPPHQDAIDALYKELCEGDKSNGNGNGDHKHAGVAAFRNDAEILAKCRSAKNSAKFADLYETGDTHAYHGGNASNADFALIEMFRFYTQAADQIDRLMRGSALSRPKWNENRVGKTWLRDSIDNALTRDFDAYSWPDGASLNTGGGEPDGTNFDSFTSPPIGVGVVNESFSLPFRTAKQISEETPQDTEWLVFPYLAKGTITEVAGAIKKSGKTTFLTCLARKVLDGAQFMNGLTSKTGIVFLTEQGPRSFRKALQTAGLEDREDFHVLYWHDVIGMAWAEVVAAASEHARKVGAELLIVDVISRWVGLEGDSENSAGSATEAMRPLKEAVSSGLTVAYARHDRKGGGDVGESGRGSSQFGGDVDQMLHLKRPEGNMRNTIRVLEALGRFSDETPESVSIEFDPESGEYRCLGESGAVAEQDAMRTICEFLPVTHVAAWETKEVVEAAGKKEIKRSVCIAALNKLTEAETICRIGEGKKGSPYRYYKPLPEDEEFLGAEKDSFTTPTPREQTKNKNPKPTCEHGATIGNRCIFCEKEQDIERF